MATKKRRKKVRSRRYKGYVIKKRTPGFKAVDIFSSKGLYQLTAADRESAKTIIDELG